MTSDSSKKKMVIAVITGLVIIAAVLVVIIVKVNGEKEDKSQDDISKTVDNSSNDTVVNNSDMPSSDETEDGRKAANQDDGTKKTIETTETNNIDDSETDDKAKTEQKIPVTVVLSKYKEIEADYSPVEITDEVIDEKLEELRREYSRYIDLPDRAFQEKDMAIVTTNTFIDDKYYEEYSVFCLQDIIGSGLMPDFIEEDIIGRNKGDFFDIYKDYPDDYTDVPEMAGKTVRYNVELVDGFSLYVPDLTDDFIKEYTPYSSIAACYTDMKKDLQEEENKKADELVTESIKKSLVEACSFEGPIDDEIKKSYVLKLQEENDFFVNNYYMEAATYYALVYDMSISDYQKMVMEQAEFETKYNLALDEVVQLENLSSTYPDLSKAELHEKAEQLIIESAKVNGK